MDAFWRWLSPCSSCPARSVLVDPSERENEDPTSTATWATDAIGAISAVIWREQETSQAEKQQATAASPLHSSDLEGVKVMRWYDHWDPRTRIADVRNITDADGVVHARRFRGDAPRRSAEDFGTGSSRSSQSSRTSESSTGSSRSSQSNSLQSSTSSVTRSLVQSALTLSSPDVEVITRWGVLAGKIMYYRVLALTTLSHKLISRCRVAKAGKHGLWSRVKTRAKQVVVAARAITKEIALEPEDVLDSDWMREGLLERLFTTEYVDTLMILAKATTKLVAVQPILAETKTPCKVFGDIHGQLRDMLMLFKAYGAPGDKDGPSYIFNGDFVDRGDHQLEVIGLLFALKICLPSKIWLVRGNHEDRCMNEKYGFKNECAKRLGKEFGLKTYELFEDAFDHLPLACLISERILCVHGGIGDGRWDLNQLRSLARPIDEKMLQKSKSKWVLNILWSDPIEDDNTQDQGCVIGVHESPRLSSAQALRFGWDVTKTFCAKNGLGLIIRSHQSKTYGLGFDVMHDNMLMRVFSARDYHGGGNDGAILDITCQGDSNDVTCQGGTKDVLEIHPQVLRSSQK